ncbi:unnamed protein product, partial [Lymnaea stagnalis]
EVIGLVGDEIVEFCNLILTILVSFLVVSGIFCNVINVIVFVRLGLTDATNISLLGLAVADIGVLLTMIGYCVIFSPLTIAAVPSRDIIDAVNYVVLGTPHLVFSRISGLLTGWINISRLVCVTWPLRVNTLFTRQRTSLAVLTAYTFMFASAVPTFIAHRIGMRFNPALNITVVGLLFIAETEELENITISVNVAAQMATFVVVTLSTLFLTRSLHKVAQWRGSVSRQTSKSSTRDKMLVKMVILISVVFIVCSLPTVVVNEVMPFLNEFNINGRERNAFILTCGIFFLLQSVNAAVNFFIYLAMSSKFKHSLCTMF